MRQTGNKKSHRKYDGLFYFAWELFLVFQSLIDNDMSNIAQYNYP